MQLNVTMQLSQPVVARQARVARPVRAFSAGSAYLGTRIQRSKTLGVPQLPARRGRSSAAAQPVRAAFFGVGAPEAILVGVVALVVFGPKGLAQAAKSLGSTLRSFAPTIRELTSVSQELKSTLEQEIGINEIKEELSKPAVPTPRPPPTNAPEYAGSSSSSEGEQPKQQGAALSELADSMAAAGQRVDTATAALVDPDIERKRAAAAAAAWGGAAPAAAPAAPAAAPAAAEAAQPAAAAAAAAPKPRAVEAMSLDELEAELAKRKAAVAKGQLPKQLSAEDA
ncbi:hypothetical protein ABPG75_003882 [Micractinium tetrahymenae]